MALNMMNEAATRYRTQRVAISHEHRASGITPEGRDFVAFNRCDDGSVTLLLGDVEAPSINGIDPASAIANQFALVSLFLSRPSEILAQLNCMLVAEAFSSHCALRANTLVCRFAPGVPYMLYASAAAPTPVLFRDRMTHAALPAGGCALGTDPDAAFEDLTVSFHAGDAFVAFTDGVSASRTKNAPRGKSGISGVVEAVRSAMNRNQIPNCHDVFAAIEQRNGGLYTDDATLVVASAFAAM